MATEAQINANRLNAQHSTGARTDAGKAASSRNHLILGLYTRQDYVKPDERDLYKEFCQTMHSELNPATLLEEALVAEITGATWRLRRCSNAEGHLADYATKDPLLDESTEKTRRSIERARASAHSQLHRSINQLRKLQTARIAHAPTAELSQRDAPYRRVEQGQLGSNCAPASTAPPTPLQTPRNAPCPCRSGQKYKRCCGKNSPPVLGKAA